MDETASKKIIWLLKVAVAFSFLYAATSGFIEPNNWVGFFPRFMTNILPGPILLRVFEIVEVLVALALFFMKNPFYPAVLGAIMLLGVVIFNLPQLDILFRDIPIALTAIAIAVYSMEKTPLEAKTESRGKIIGEN
ncbi:hypothetical protein COV42_00960 [Candidatus Campbellbacteria bacterium CG11_big_fil_rev_8_21_14_0_20_44_21]|uniref:DoxX family protein n=1 Tax=Candidatus Campbellbacteria bacterium CG22_combo_CG10-13_8_21_14_all_43_18 TaxID=1974530 RepID=A0A2H0DXL3_9BACT|nr:MAG: hypothetical protein COW82_02025 [Candidatus Campbellbacteria bacterium CG22_combo_CG10-13_8_21_14_all_43_18]PIR24395.1 MAG: hypothetical protein COV42_00960 [Candidatus Campbellbacteria bacterium CG11_big_fil_rev_8_21_14_0_20_44_21]